MYVESMLCWCQGRGILWLVCRRLLLVAVCNLASSQCNVIISLWLCGVVGMDIQYLTVGIASAISIPGKWFPKFNYSPYLVILVVAINNESHEEVAIWIQYNANSTCAIFEIFSSFSCCVIQMQIHLYKWMSISLKLASDNHTVSQEMWHATFLCFLCISDCILNFSCLLTLLPVADFLGFLSLWLIYVYWFMSRLSEPPVTYIWPNIKHSI